MNIIIVDDDAFVSASLKIILESCSDITVLATGANGHDAISLYDTYSPDVLLMDIRMEGMDGLTAAKEIITGHPTQRFCYLLPLPTMTISSKPSGPAQRDTS